MAEKPNDKIQGGNENDSSGISLAEKGADVSGSSSSAPGIAGQGRSVTSRKIEANRRNALKSSGPKTGEGKAKSSFNALKHGFFSKRLFAAGAPAADQQDYVALADDLRAHYAPEGPLETILFDRLTTDLLRFARVLPHEQKLMASEYPFEVRSADRIQRCLTTLDRQIAGAIQELERIQSKRKADAARPVPPEVAKAKVSREQTNAASTDQAIAGSKTAPSHR